MRRLLWMIGQAAVIIGLSAAMYADPRLRAQFGAVVLVNIVLVAFATAVITRLLDWLRRPRAARRLLSDERKAQRDRERLSAAGRRPGELFEERARGRVR